MFFRKSAQHQTLPDQDLISLYKKTQDSNYVGVLYERYSLQIYIICKKYIRNEEETRDTAMSLFEYLLKELLKYEIENFKNWLGRATKNYCLMKIRKENSQIRKEDEWKINEALVMDMEDLMHHNGEETREKEVQALRAALSELKGEQRECVELFYLQNKSYQEVSEITGYDMNQVKSYIQNGKRNLRLRLEE